MTLIPQWIGWGEREAHWSNATPPLRTAGHLRDSPHFESLELNDGIRPMEQDAVANLDVRGTSRRRTQISLAQRDRETIGQERDKEVRLAPPPHRSCRASSARAVA